MNRTATDILFILFVTTTMGLLNWWTAPTMSDDILYRFVWQAEWEQPLEPVRSLGDVVRSQVVHYEQVNGRSVSHALAQVVLNLMPSQLAKLLNTAMFLLLLLLVRRYVAQSKEESLGIMSIAFLLLLLVISGFNGGFLWMHGSVVYLWTLVFTMAFLLMLRKLGDARMGWKLSPLLLFSLLTGWMHEAIALPLSVAFIVYMATNRKGLAAKATTYCMLAYMAGAMLIVASPALWERADVGGMPLMQRLLSGAINIVRCRISWLLIVSLAVVLSRSRQRFKGFVREHRHLLTAWTAAMAIVLLCGTSIDRVPIFADTLAMLLLLQLWRGAWLLRHQTALAGAVVVVSLAVALPAISMNRQNHQNFLFHQRQLLQGGDTIVRVRQLPADMPAWQQCIKQRYVFPTVEFGFYSCYMAFDSLDINSKALAALTGRESVVLLPEDVVDKMRQDSTAYQSMEEDVHHNLYIQRLNAQQQADSVIFVLGDEPDIKFHQRLLSYKGSEYALDSFKHEVVDIDGRRYLVMTIPTTNIRRRITDVIIK